MDFHEIIFFISYFLSVSLSFLCHRRTLFRDVFRTHTNIFHLASQLLAIKYFRKKLFDTVLNTHLLLSVSFLLGHWVIHMQKNDKKSPS